MEVNIRDKIFNSMKQFSTSLQEFKHYNAKHPANVVLKRIQFVVNTAV